MIKCIATIRRREGISHSEFAEYYEQHHAPLAQKYMPEAVRYERRYLSQAGLQHIENGKSENDSYDVLTEIWFRDEAAMNRCLNNLAMPDIGEIIIEDEKRFIDRESIRFYIIEKECQSQGTALNNNERF